MRNSKSGPTHKNESLELLEIKIEDKRNDSANSSNIKRQVGEKIFDELQLLEYYCDLKTRDESIISVCKGPQPPTLEGSGELGPTITMSFLNAWENKRAIKNTCSWDLDETNNNRVTKEKFVDLFLQHSSFGCKDKPDNADSQDYRPILKWEEEKWCIRQGFVDEWGPTFEKFLHLYNTQDINTVVHTLTNNEKHQRKDQRLSISELKNWMQPKFKPPLWKKLFQPDAYEKEKSINQLEFQTLIPLGSTDKVDKAEFINRIMKELRNGDKKIEKLISLRNVCRRLERAEFYSLYPFPWFLFAVSVVQIMLFCFHKQYYSEFFGDAYLNPWCSMHVVNPDRVWYEPWRFLFYGFVHNSVGHLASNIVTQLVVGLPLELSHSSWRVALVYLFGIMYAGLGREIADDSQLPLAGASGGVYALIAAHLSHLFLNWNDDTYVFRQSINWDGRKTNECKEHKPPQALPAECARNIRYVRLSITLAFLLLESTKCFYNECPTNVSYWAHGFGALSGFIMGIIFLRARFLRKTEKQLKYALLLIAYGLPLSYVMIQYGRKFKKYNTPPYSNCHLVHWAKYEEVCQDTCYRRNHTNIEESICKELFTIHSGCGKGLVTFNSINVTKCDSS